MNMCNVMQLGPHPFRLHFDNKGRHMWDATEFLRGLRRHITHPTVSLAHLIQQGLLSEPRRGGAFSMNDKAILVLSLSRCMLHLFRGAWMQQLWSAEMLHFPKSTFGEVVHDIHSPYITCVLSNNPGASLQSVRVTDAFSVTLAFAKLLLEIELGELIATGDPDLPSSWAEIRNDLFEIIEDRKDEYARDSFNCAVRGCLNFGEALRQDNSSGEGTCVSYAVIRERLYQDVIAHLEANIRIIPNLARSIAPRDLILESRAVDLSSREYPGSHHARAAIKEATTHKDASQGSFVAPAFKGQTGHVALLDGQEHTKAEVDRE